MQVKKFEARSMKDAIQMIKDQLGPEAIILSAKDIGDGYGIGGGTSVEVTAAVSEMTLKKKQLAEKKLNDKDRQRFQESSARQQKEFIRKVFDKEDEGAKRPHTITSIRYADIPEEGLVEEQTAAPTEAATVAPVQSAAQRIKSAAQEAMQAAYFIDPDKKTGETSSTQVAEPEENNFEKDLEINQLKSEINQLRKVIQQFQQVPQQMVGRHPGADSDLSYEVSFMYEKLIESGISEEIVVDILKAAEGSLSRPQLKKKALVDAWVVRHIMDHTKIATGAFSGRYHVFVGTTGQGKTSSLVKLASHMAITQKKKIAIVSCDTTKVASHEQLKIYAQILNVPFAFVDDKKHWATVDEALQDVDHILVDAPGLNLKDTEQKLLLNELVPQNASRRIHLVMSALAKDADINEVAQNYQTFGFDDVIFTRLDETVQHGIIFNFLRRFEVPLHSFGIGPNIPDDFELATRERLVDLIFKLTKFRKEERGE